MLVNAAFIRFICKNQYKLVTLIILFVNVDGITLEITCCDYIKRKHNPVMSKFLIDFSQEEFSAFYFLLPLRCFIWYHKLKCQRVSYYNANVLYSSVSLNFKQLMDNTTQLFHCFAYKKYHNCTVVLMLDRLPTMKFSFLVDLVCRL